MENAARMSYLIRCIDESDAGGYKSKPARNDALLKPWGKDIDKSASPRTSLLEKTARRKKQKTRVKWRKNRDETDKQPKSCDQTTEMTRSNNRDDQLRALRWTHKSTVFIGFDACYCAFSTIFWPFPQTILQQSPNYQIITKYRWDSRFSRLMDIWFTKSPSQGRKNVSFYNKV